MADRTKLNKRKGLSHSSQNLTNPINGNAIIRCFWENVKWEV